MLRLSEEDDRVVAEFQALYAAAREAGFGRIFRSPTLFEDMVKCILLCNCQYVSVLMLSSVCANFGMEQGLSSYFTGCSRGNTLANFFYRLMLLLSYADCCDGKSFDLLHIINSTGSANGDKIDCREVAFLSRGQHI